MLTSHSISSLFGDGKRFVISQFLTYFARVEVKASCDRNILLQYKEEEPRPNTSSSRKEGVGVTTEKSMHIACSSAQVTSRSDSKNHFLQSAAFFSKSLE